MIKRRPDDSRKAESLFKAFATLRNEMTAAGRPITAGKAHAFLTSFNGGDVPELARLFDLITQERP